MTVPKAGYKGAVYFGAVKIASATWTHAGGERQMQAVDEFSDEIILDIPLQIVGGVVTITGHYKMDSDDGQKLAKTRFLTGEKVTDLKLYTDYTSTPKVYLTPGTDFKGTGVDSYCTITNCLNVGDDKSGIGTITITMKVSGVLVQEGDTDVIGVSTIGVIDVTFGAANTCIATFIGELTGAGTETTIWPKVQFEYGETTSYLHASSPTALQNMSMTPQMFDDDSAALLKGDTLYHYRAVAVSEGAVKYYGADKTFTTPDS